MLFRQNLFMSPTSLEECLFLRSNHHMYDRSYFAKAVRSAKLDVLLLDYEDADEEQSEESEEE